MDCYERKYGLTVTVSMHREEFTKTLHFLGLAVAIWWAAVNARSPKVVCAVFESCPRLYVGQDSHSVGKCAEIAQTPRPNNL